MSAILLICLLELPLEYLINTTALTKHTTSALAFALGSLITTLILFVPKVYNILIPFSKKVHGQAADTMSSKKAPVMAVVHEMMSSKKVLRKDPSIKGNGVDDFHTLSADQQVCVCNEQILFWRARLLHVNEQDSSNMSLSISTNHAPSAPAADIQLNQHGGDVAGALGEESDRRTNQGAWVTDMTRREAVEMGDVVDFNSSV